MKRNKLIIKLPFQQQDISIDVISENIDFELMKSLLHPMTFQIIHDNNESSNCIINVVSDIDLNNYCEKFSFYDEHVVKRKDIVETILKDKHKNIYLNLDSNRKLIQCVNLGEFIPSVYINIESDDLIIRLVRIIRGVIIQKLFSRINCILHASAVKINDSVIAFVGEEGAGKTTLVNHLINNGFSFFSNDCVFLNNDQAFSLPYRQRVRQGNKIIYKNAEQIHTSKFDLNGKLKAIYILDRKNDYDKYHAYKLSKLPENNDFTHNSAIPFQFYWERYRHLNHEIPDNIDIIKLAYNDATDLNLNKLFGKYI